MPRPARALAGAVTLALTGGACAGAAATPAPLMVAVPSGVTTDAAPTFSFTARGPARCRLDWEPWTDCASPYTALAPLTGPHVFGVRTARSAPAFQGWTRAAACVPPYGAFGPGAWPPACWRPYSDASPFNRPLPARPRLARGSAAMVQRVTGWGPPSPYSVGEQDTPNDFAHPTYWSRLSDPRFLVRCAGCEIDGLRIRIPVAARPAGGSDHHLAVVAQGNGREYDLWRARLDLRRHVVHAEGGGRTRIGGSGLASGATAAGFGNLAGIIRAQELASGEIDHALFMIVHCDGGRTVYPARGRAFACSQEGRSNRAAPPLGARFQLDMSDAEIGAVRLPAWKRAIYMAMAHYGMFAGDTGGGSSWSLQFESDSTYTSFGADPLLLAFGQANTGESDDTFRDEGDGRYTLQVDDPRIDWRKRLRVIAPCVSAASC
ncbi:MAG: hypothetical protein ACJ768_10275 [Gaiellaceae bacterium]